MTAHKRQAGSPAGTPLCGNPGGTVVQRWASVTCPDCLRLRPLNQPGIVIAPSIPLGWPPLRAEAERLAQEYLAARFSTDGPPTPTEATVDAFARLLADLSRPASRDHWVRWGAEHDTRPLSLVPRIGQRGFTLGKHPGWSEMRDDPARLLATLLALSPVEVPDGR